MYLTAARLSQHGVNSPAIFVLIPPVLLLALGA